MLSRILIIGLVGSALVFGQRGGGGGGRGGGMAPQGSFGPVNKLDRIADMFKLTKEQKKELKQIFDAAQKEAAPLHEGMTKARLAVGEAVTTAKPPDELSKAVNAEAALETQMTMIELNAFAKVAALMDPDQQQRAGMLFQMMRGMFANKNWNSD
jgi:Spy/CpxP family protein refolding chaperone